MKDTRLVLFVAMLMCSVSVSGTMTEMMNGSDYYTGSGFYQTKVGEVRDCSVSSPAGACDDSDSAIIGYYNHRSGWSAVSYLLTLDETVECVENDLTIRLDRQFNGPDVSTKNGYSNKGWSNGSIVSENVQHAAFQSDDFSMGLG